MRMDQNFEYHGRKGTEFLGLPKLNDFSVHEKQNACVMCMCHVTKAHEGSTSSYEGNLQL